MDDAWPRDGRLVLARPDGPERLAFELWLQEGLEREYGGPVETALPPDLRALLNLG